MVGLNRTIIINYYINNKSEFWRIEQALLSVLDFISTYQVVFRLYKFKLCIHVHLIKQDSHINTNIRHNIVLENGRDGRGGGGVSPHIPVTSISVLIFLFSLFYVLQKSGTEEGGGLYIHLIFYM